MREGPQALYSRLKCAPGRIVVTGHEHPDADSALSCVLMQRLLGRMGVRAEIVLPGGGDKGLRKTLAPLGIDPAAYDGKLERDDSLVLVDHHRTDRPGCVVACIDHHPTEDPPAYPYVQIERSGACAYLVFRLMEEAGVSVTPEDMRLAVAGLYLDTMALRSTKILPEEIAWATSQAEKLGMNIAWLEREGLGLTDMNQAPQLLAQTDRKEYRFGGVHVVSACVKTDAMTSGQLKEVLAAIRAEMAGTDIRRWVFLVQNPIAGRTARYDLDADGVKHTEYDFLASRAKDVMPSVEREMTRGEN